MRERFGQARLYVSVVDRLNRDRPHPHPLHTVPAVAGGRSRDPLSPVLSASWVGQPCFGAVGVIRRRVKEWPAGSA